MSGERAGGKTRAPATAAGNRAEAHASVTNEKEDMNLENHHDPRELADFETDPLTRGEYISAMVHFYRGELTRANTWRIRLDTTTNWAIVTTMGFLSFAFGVKHHSHATIILGMFLMIHFLTLEARRFRFFDVWRNRLRMIEKNFYGPILTRDLHSQYGEWGNLVAHDLLHPCFKITFLQALKARFKRNYLIIFTILGVSWVTKLFVHPEQTGAYWVDRMAIGPLAWYYPFGLVFGLYMGLFLLLMLVPNVRAPELEYWSADNPLGPVTDF